MPRALAKKKIIIKVIAKEEAASTSASASGAPASKHLKIANKMWHQCILLNFYAVETIHSPFWATLVFTAWINK